MDEKEAKKYHEYSPDVIIHIPHTPGAEPTRYTQCPIPPGPEVSGPDRGDAQVIGEPKLRSVLRMSDGSRVVVPLEVHAMLEIEIPSTFTYIGDCRCQMPLRHGHIAPCAMVRAGSQSDLDSWTRRAEAEAREENKVKILVQVISIERNNWSPDRAVVEMVEVDEKSVVKDGRTLRLSMSDDQAVDFQYKDCYTVTIEEAL